MPEGRGITLPFAITYSSGGIHRLDSNGTLGIRWTDETFSGSGPYGQGGWAYAHTPSLEYSNWTTKSGSLSTEVDCTFYSNFTFTDSSGSVHNLNLGWVVSAGNGVPGGPVVGGVCGTTAPSGGDTQVSAYLTGDTSGPSYVMVEDLEGTIYGFFSGLLTFIEDRNGNKITNFTQDILGRTSVSISGSYAPGGTQTVNAGGLTYQVHWTSVPILYTPPNHLTQPNQLNGANCPGSGSVPTISESQTVISSITLPNGRQYAFSYDPVYGLLAGITYPDGGRVEYTWSTALDPSGSPYSQIGVFNGYNATGAVVDSCIYQYTPPFISERDVYFDGSTEALKQQFEPKVTWPVPLNSYGWLTKSNTVTSTDNFLNIGTPQSVKTYSYTAATTFYQPYTQESAASQIPVEQTVTTTDWGSGTVLDTETKGWYNQFQLACDFHAVRGPGASTLTSGHFYQYTYGLTSDDRQYDYAQGPSAASTCLNSPGTLPANPARETTTSYAGFTNPVAAYWQASSLHFGRPYSAKVKDANGAVVAETDFAYDGESPSPVSVANHDESLFGAGNANGRGNATSVTHKCFGCIDSVTTFLHDETGQVTQMTDPCGNPSCGDMSGSNHTTSYLYIDGNAYLSQITDPLGHTKKFTYNFTTGEVTSSVDENNLTTSYYYDTKPSKCTTPQDTLNRLTEIAYPTGGGDTQFCYDDSAPSVATWMQINSSLWKTTVSTRDGMGHVIQTSLTSDPDGIDYTDITYYGTGLEKAQTVPYRGSPPAPQTAYWYDALGRKTEQLDSDNASHQWWSYNGVTSYATQPNVHVRQDGQSTLALGWVDYQDENGNDWQRASDSFGDLLDVMEPNGTSQTPSMETDYTYDSLSNLLSVTQWGGPKNSTGARTRSFTYDSLSRLIQSQNPETGWVCYGTTPNQPANGTNCISGYDLNGNLGFKTDARGVTTQFTYDSLNRLTRKSYPNDLSGTPVSCFQYDASSSPFASGNLIGHLTNQWTQRTVSGNCVAPTSYSTSAGYLTLRAFLSYDSMGRPTSENQCTPSYCPSQQSNMLVYTYDLAGNLTSYPTGFGGPAISQTLSGAGWLQTVTSSWTNPSAQLFSAQPSPSAACSYTPGYSPFGALANATLGTGLTESRSYGTRLRLKCERDTGLIHSNGTPGASAVTITGWEQSQ